MDLARGTQALETSLLLEAIFQRFGKDFRHHNRNTILKKLHGFMQKHAIPTLSGLQEKILHDPAFISPLLYALDERKSGLFSPSEQILKLRTSLVPWLRSCPAPNIWVAEAVSAADVFGWIILLLEENLYHKTHLYVTGPNPDLLAEAKRGRFSSELFADYEENYRRAGGTASLADYCTHMDENILFNPELHSRITWTEYNLGTDASPNEFEAIVCCSGLADLTLYMRHRALRIFCESQPVFGLLAIMGENPIEVTPLNSGYKAISATYGIYQRDY